MYGGRGGGREELREGGWERGREGGGWREGGRVLEAWWSNHPPSSLSAVLSSHVTSPPSLPRPLPPYERTRPRS